MANEITITGSLVLNRSTDPKFSQSMKFSGIQSTQSGSDYMCGSQVITTGEENLDKGNDIGTIGYFMLKNLHATNSVTIGTSTGELPIKVLAGQAVGPVYVDAAEVIVLASGSATTIEYLIIEK